jgi:hypothetical protein
MHAPPQWYPTHVISRHNYEPGAATAVHGGHHHGGAHTGTAMQPGYSGSAGTTSGATYTT